MHLPATFRNFLRNLQRHHLKSFSVRTSVSLAEDPRKRHTNVKKFNEIPGPVSLPGIGTSYLYLFGVYSAKQHEAALKKYQKYGPIIKEEINPGKFVVWVFDHNDMEHLFLSENNIPLQQSRLALKVLKNEQSDFSWKPHEELLKSLGSPHAARTYLPAIDNIIQEFVSSHLSHNEDDFLPYLLRLSLQLTSLVAFDTKLDCLSSGEMKPDSTSSLLIENVLTSNHLAFFLDQFPDPKNVPLLSKRFEKNIKQIESFAASLVKEQITLANGNMKKHESAVPSPLELCLTSPNMDLDDVVPMCVNLLLNGIETTAYTASYALYQLAKDERVQDFLRLESRKILKTPKDPISAETLANAPYARAVLNEVFRMNPTLLGSRRILTQDTILSGYHIPKGTTVVTQNQAACRLQKNFIQPNKFLPERWITGSPVQVKDNPFLVLPFGHGHLSCIARHLAEQQMLTFLLRIVHDHTISWTSKKTLDCKNLNSSINKPDTKLAFTFNRVC